MFYQNKGWLSFTAHRFTHVYFVKAFGNICNHILCRIIPCCICLLFVLLRMEQALFIVADAETNLTRCKVYSALLLRGL